MNNLKTSLSYKVCFSVLFSILLSSCGSNSTETSTNDPQNPNGAGPAPINLTSNGGDLNPSDLGSAGNYVMLAKTGISNGTGSHITGDIGVSPAAATYITGFSPNADLTNVFSTSSSVTGKIYAADYAVPTPSNLTTAIGTMQTAYTDAAGRTNPNFNELATGNLGGLTLTPGLYKWTTTVSIPTNVTIAGGANDVWIFQTTGDLLMSAAQSVILSGGAQAKNIFWQVAGQVTFNANSHFEGIILCKTAVNFLDLVSMNGRIYAQTAISLNNNTVVQQ